MSALPHGPNFRLDGKRALVTGAGRGIGLGCATALARAGAHVTLCARSHEELTAAAGALAAEGGSVDVLPLDVTQAAAFAAALGSRSGYDVLVSNAGTNRPAPFTEVTEDDYDTVLTLNLRAAFFVAQAVARRMIAEGRRGSIIHMSSQMGHVGGARRTVYCASKWGLEGLNRAMALDLAPHGIRCNTIAPTFIETEMTRPFLADAAFRDSTLARIKLGRLGRVEDLMGAVVFLASDAASLITGTSLVVDGGWTAD